MECALKQIEILTKVMQLVISSKVCPDTNPKDWAKIILQAHNKGYLYIWHDGDDITACACAYRIPSWDEKYKDEMPVKETGKTLYVAWLVSEKRDPLTLMKMLREYKKFNEIEEIVYYRRNSDKDIRHHKIRKDLVHEL